MYTKAAQPPLCVDDPPRLHAEPGRSLPARSDDRQIRHLGVRQQDVHVVEYAAPVTCTRPSVARTIMSTLDSSTAE